jgi:hypothetical protein
VTATCYCHGGPAHTHRPHGGGARILACPPWPVLKLATIALPLPACPACGGERDEESLKFCADCRRIAL